MTTPRLSFSVSQVNANDNLTAPNPSSPPAAQNFYNNVTSPPREPCNADSDSRYTELSDLPSTFMFYPFERISIRRMNVADVRKAYKAQSTSDFRAFAQLLVSTCDRPVYDLTISDFWFCMYYHQNNSYPTSPTTATFTCVDPNHKERVKKGELSEDTLLQKVNVTISDLEVMALTPEKVAQINALAESIKNQYGVFLYPPTVQDTIENLEELDKLKEQALINVLNDKLRDNPNDTAAALELQRAEREYADLEWINKYAMSLHSTHGKTLQEKRDFLETMEDISIFDKIDEFLALSEHGVRETVNVKCKVCAAAKRVEARLAAADFLPEVQRKGLA